jgi:diguanylate cyclase (GGDEF)-like protein
VVRESGTGAVRLLGLGDPKGVNDTLGHLAGDKILAAVLARLEHVTRASDPLCRFGGEEFIYLSEGLTAPGEAESVVRGFFNTLVESFSIVGGAT